MELVEVIFANSLNDFNSIVDLLTHKHEWKQIDFRLWLYPS